MRKIDKIIVHTSDSPDTMDIGVTEIRVWHVRDNKWKDIGYSYVVRRNGIVEVGRPLDEVGAHTKNHNATSIGICWVGKTNMEPEQLKSLIRLIKSLMIQFNLKSTDVYGHKEFDKGKTCPNYNMDDLRKML